MAYFHFTLGPVQGFVAQARRTRDFWAGSFILSWLSAVAMLAVKYKHGSIEFPLPDDGFMHALETGEKGPTQGTIPNRFKAVVPDDFDAEAVAAAVQAAWQALADRVYEHDLQKKIAGSDSKTRKIWDRQIGQFWEMSWAMTDDAGDSSIIDRLKNWRSHLPPDEAGVKCMMMEGWQELSGEERPGSDKLTAFWGLVRNGEKMQTDLRPKEHLCAIAFVKRRFVRHFEGFSAVMPGGWQVHGWNLPTGVPSVHYMSAAPWLAKLIDKANGDSALAQKVWEFHDLAYELTQKYGEWPTNIRCVQQAMQKGTGQHKWAALDGTVFFDAMLENPNLWDDAQNEIAGKLLKKLEEVRRKADFEPVSPFYAVLLMDGDHLGIQMSEAGKPPLITKGLAAFTAAVPAIVHRYNGFLIYAGGDDVLALLPLEYAFSCAVALRNHYLNCFDLDKVATSISGAIEFAHVKMPLGKILRDAHDLLDNVAKEGRGRDAIACRVWKPGGLAVEWAMPWKCALMPDTIVLEKLADEFRATRGVVTDEEGTTEQAAQDNDRFVGKFFFKIRERFALLNPEKCEFRAPGEQTGGLDPEQAVSLMAAEYLDSGAATTGNLERARAIVRPLLEQCRPVRRDQKETDPRKWPRSTCLDADGAMLLRFLAQKGVER